MSETTFYAILFFGTFPALWLLAWWLDRVWPYASEMEVEEEAKPTPARRRPSTRRTVH